jgi:DNA-directed RNA polymerase specialized sigma24 family protein
LKQWDLTEQSFERLLEFLDSDRDRAAQHYEKIRGKLCRFFEWKGCIPGADYADEAIDRVARKIEEGIHPQPENPYLYFHGVAVNVIRERWRKADRDPLPLPPNLAVHPAEPEHQHDERRLVCLLDCLDRLPPVSRELLTTYHLGGSGLHIGRRKSMAERLNVPAAALRLRVYRIRRQLERCMRETDSLGKER